MEMLIWLLKGMRVLKFGDADTDFEGYESSGVLCKTEEEQIRERILDSRCFFRMHPHKNWFLSYKNCEEGRVLLGNDKTLKVVGIGSIKLQLTDGAVRILQEVRYVPELRRNLISLDILDCNGFSCKIELVKEILRSEFEMEDMKKARFLG